MHTMKIAKMIPSCAKYPILFLVLFENDQVVLLKIIKVK